jgi:gamma-tubulin complex component 4
MLVVERAQLTLTLHTLKDFFLLGRGELFLAFIDQANSMLQTPPAATTQHGILKHPDVGSRDIAYFSSTK